MLCFFGRFLRGWGCEVMGVMFWEVYFGIFEYDGLNIRVCREIG